MLFAANSAVEQEVIAIAITIALHRPAVFIRFQWRAEGGGRMGRWPRASKAGGHPKSKTTKIKML